MQLKDIINNIFSVKNNEFHKIITILFFKIKLNLLKKNKRMIKTLPINNNKIVFMNFNGKGYGCNPKYISEEIINQKLPYELVWVTNDKKDFPKNIKIVKYSKKNAIKELATSKIWVLNHRPRELYKLGLYKKPEQYYIHTWHAWSLKKIEKDVDNFLPDICEWSKLDSKYINLLLAASDDDKKVLERCFYYNGEIINLGLPRNDIFNFDKCKQISIVENVRQKLLIDKSKKILLYAPTFRDDGRLNVFDLDIEKVILTCEKKFNNKFVALLRLHPKVVENAYNLFNFSENIINVTNYPDVQELLLASDVMITDYSSCILDFILQKKPSFIYASDYEQYINERNFNINLKDMPSPFADNNNELCHQIKIFDENKYNRDLDVFFKKYGCHPQKNVSKTIVEIIKEQIKK